MATSGVSPKRCRFSMWRARLGAPAHTASTLGMSSSATGTPPCSLRARTVQTSTTAWGASPACRHLMFKNFSAPRSAPKPASVTTMSESANAAFVATTVLQPCAMLANGPPWTNAGLPSKVCTRFGCRASRSSAESAPTASRSRAVTVLPSLRRATTTSPSRRAKSCRSRARHNTAISSEAAVMSKPVCRCWPRPTGNSKARRARSFTSRARRQVAAAKSTSSALPQWRWLSSNVASRLWAAVTACRSPLKCRLMSVMGAIWAQPPPVAPPFMPKQGPKEGSLSAAVALAPSRFSASTRPMVVVVLPSPAGVGEIAVTSTSLPASRSCAMSSSAASGSFALWWP